MEGVIDFCGGSYVERRKLFWFAVVVMAETSFDYGAKCSREIYFDSGPALWKNRCSWMGRKSRSCIGHRRCVSLEPSPPGVHRHGSDRCLVLPRFIDRVRGVHSAFHVVQVRVARGSGRRPELLFIVVERDGVFETALVQPRHLERGGKMRNTIYPKQACRPEIVLRSVHHTSSNTLRLCQARHCTEEIINTRDKRCDDQWLLQSRS